MILQEGEYSVYTDGSCRGGAGGWGFVIIGRGRHVYGYGGLLNCTNNQAEMMAAIMAMKCFKGDNTIIVTTDSMYLRNGMCMHLYKWERKGYIGTSGAPIKNIPLWGDLYKLQIDQAPTWEWVKGHSGDHYNEIADKLALKGRSYVEDARKSKKKVTSTHDFCEISDSKCKCKSFYINGNPKIYYEDING